VHGRQKRKREIRCICAASVTIPNTQAKAKKNIIKTKTNNTP